MDVIVVQPQIVYGVAVVGGGKGVTHGVAQAKEVLGRGNVTDKACRLALTVDRKRLGGALEDLVTLEIGNGNTQGILVDRNG